MRADKEITPMRAAHNERDNTIAMVEHARGLAQEAIDDLKKGHRATVFTFLERIVALNPPAASDGTNVES